MVIDIAVQLISIGTASILPLPAIFGGTLSASSPQQIRAELIHYLNATSKTAADHF